MIDTRRAPEPHWVGGPDVDDREPWQYLRRCQCGRWLPIEPARTESWADESRCTGILIAVGFGFVTECGREVAHPAHTVIEWAGTTGIWTCSAGHDHREEL